MFDRIVVPVDGSARSLEAVRAGALIAGDGGARLDVVTVVGPHGDRAAEEEYLGAQLRSLGDLPGAPVAVALEGDSAAPALARYVADLPRTLLVMSSNGRGRSAAVLGSVAEELLAAELGPIVIVGPNASAHALLSGDLLVALDGSHASEHAIDVAAAWCAGRERRAWVLTVVTTAAGAQPDLDVSESAYVRRRAAQLQARLGREVDYEVLHGGSPARSLVDYAEATHAGLIVMGTHGRTGLRRMAMGSVAADVIRNAPCPVLVERLASADDARADSERHEVRS